MNNYLVFDTEYPLNRHKLDREIVAYAGKSSSKLFSVHSTYTCFNKSSISPVYMYRKFEQKGTEKLNYDVVVGHNIKADLLKIWHEERLQEWFKYGGKIWDTSLAHYMLSGQQEKYPELIDIAVRCYGCKQREKLMKKYWCNKHCVVDKDGYIITDGNILYTLNNKDYDRFFTDYWRHGHSEFEPIYKQTERDCLQKFSKEFDCRYIEGPISTENIPKDIVLVDVKNDVLDTEQIYLKQLKLAIDKEMFSLIECHMDFLLSTCEIEYNGMFADKDILNNNKDKTKEYLDMKTKIFLELIKPYWKSE